MNKKLVIVLFATIFCNGVTYSSPVDGQQISGAEKSEEKPQGIDHISKKVDANATSTESHSVPASEKVTAIPPPQSPASVDSNGTAQTDSKKVTPISQPVMVSTLHPDVPVKSETKVVDHVSGNQTAEAKNASQNATSRNATEPAVDKHVIAPSNSTVGKNVTDVPVPIPNIPTSVPTSVPTSAGPTSVSTTTAPPPTSKQTVAPTTPNSVVIEHKVPAPVEEKHFDGPSFIGGIVLTIGLTAIGFIAFKYYKSGKIDMNYRTL